MCWPVFSVTQQEEEEESRILGVRILFRSKIFGSISLQKMYNVFQPKCKDFWFNLKFSPLETNKFPRAQLLVPLTNRRFTLVIDKTNSPASSKLCCIRRPPSKREELSGSHLDLGLQLYSTA